MIKKFDCENFPSSPLSFVSVLFTFHTKTQSQKCQIIFVFAVFLCLFETIEIVFSLQIVYICCLTLTNDFLSLVNIQNSFLVIKNLRFQHAFAALRVCKMTFCIFFSASFSTFGSVTEQSFVIYFLML